jgi:hypothetical protein
MRLTFAAILLVLGNSVNPAEAIGGTMSEGPRTKTDYEPGQVAAQGDGRSEAAEEGLPSFVTADFLLTTVVIRLGDLEVGTGVAQAYLGDPRVPPGFALLKLKEEVDLQTIPGMPFLTSGFRLLAVPPDDGTRQRAFLLAQRPTGVEIKYVDDFVMCLAMTEG